MQAFYINRPGYYPASCPAEPGLSSLILTKGYYPCVKNRAAARFIAILSISIMNMIDNNMKNIVN